MPYAKIHIENLGPIREGTFELRPLTIFIGPNNSGKTYAATAAYAMVNGLRFDEQYRSQALMNQRFRVADGSYVAIGRDDSNHQFVPWDTIVQVRSQYDEIKARIEEDLRSSFLDAFATDNLANLRAAGPFDLSVSVNQISENLAAFQIDADLIKTTTHVQTGFDRIPGLSFTTSEPEAGNRLHDAVFSDVIAKQIWADELHALGLPTGRAVYLPAGRLGIIQGWPVLASSAISSLRQRASGIRGDQLPIQGVLADYLERLFRLATGDRARPTYPEHFRPAGDLLNTEVLRGEIVRELSPLGMMRLIYRTKELDVPLDRASSMVADLAPLAIAMKDQLAVGDVLVLDEPESHLHPGSERQVAQVMVRIAKAGVRVVLPTHSSTIVHQISNIVRAGLLTEQQRGDLGYTDADLLRSDQIGVYQFHESDQGSTIKEIPYDKDFGWSEEEFYDVAEDISRETYQIESRMPAYAG